MLDERFRDYTCHPFVLAQAFAPGSYISFETALAWHGWIPEAVFTTASAVSGRKSRQYEYDKKINFSFYYPLCHSSTIFPGTGEQISDKWSDHAGLQNRAGH